MKTISINRAVAAPPSVKHDTFFDTATSRDAFGKRRRTTGPAANTLLAPIPRKPGQFLRKGEGNGGSPTNFVMRNHTNEQGNIVLQPIAKR